jgi:hypothetical protein
MKKLIYLLIVLFFACNPRSEKEISNLNTIHGDWAFIDGGGNYTEAFFGDTAYITYNIRFGASPYYKFFVKNDSLYSNIGMRVSTMRKIAEFTWLDDGRVILVTEFTRDTLERILNDKRTLQYLDPVIDSTLFKNAMKVRFEEFLISKGIITREEAEQFKTDSIIPEDVIKSLQK